MTSSGSEAKAAVEAARAAAKESAKLQSEAAKRDAKAAAEQAKRDAKAAAEVLKRRKVEVREYKNAKEFEKDAQKRMRVGWRLENEAAATYHPGLGSRVFLGPFARIKTRITVTWVKDS
jgi:hypothetical protein